MSTTEGRKRLQPRMSRGSWKIAVWFATSTIYFLYLLRVRRNDAPFWDEEEARRADWDRRGRAL